jgi:hypothetical protein
MCTKFPIRDTSWLVGASFSFGSTVFIVNGFFLLLPLIAPSTNFTGETPYATPASSVLGTLVFLIGAWFGVLEALNIKRGGLPVTEGLALEVVEVSTHSRKLSDEESSSDGESTHKKPHLKVSALSSTTSFPINNSTQHLTLPHAHTITTIASYSNATSSPAPQPTMIGDPNFIYWPTMHQLTTRYKHDLLFNGGLIQFIGASIFCIGTATSIPGVIDFTNTLIVCTTNLLPATLGGVLFLTAATLQTLDVQKSSKGTWRPAPEVFGWHVGMWNMIGSLGFLLAGALPYGGYLGWEQATLCAVLADFWGSWAFLVGGVLQWYGVMGNYP